jgi:fatty-acyl-CoA synthase
MTALLSDSRHVSGNLGSEEVRTFSYHNDPERTRATDLGHLDDEGFLYLTDRKAFIIISGGVTIYPQEIEDLFALHPAVADIAVIGVPDDALAAELASYARERIAHYKVPREFVFREALPRTPTGKMVKGRLREEYAALG